MTPEEQQDAYKREAARVDLQLQKAKEAKNLLLIDELEARLLVLRRDRITPSPPAPRRRLRR